MAYTAWSVIAGETPTATKWNTLGANDADFNTRITQLVADSTVGQFTDGATITLNMATRRIWEGTITADRDFVFSNVSVKRPFAVIVTQGSGGGHVPAWPAGIDWDGGVEPVPSADAGQTDMYVFIPKNSWVASSNEVYWGVLAASGME